eukprot:3875339-Prymnesium_polylepis.1
MMLSCCALTSSAVIALSTAGEPAVALRSTTGRVRRTRRTDVFFTKVTDQHTTHGTRGVHPHR